MRTGTKVSPATNRNSGPELLRFDKMWLKHHNFGMCLTNVGTVIKGKDGRCQTYKVGISEGEAEAGFWQCKETKL